MIVAALLSCLVHFEVNGSPATIRLRLAISMGATTDISCRYSPDRSGVWIVIPSTPVPYPTNPTYRIFLRHPDLPCTIVSFDALHTLPLIQQISEKRFEALPPRKPSNNQPLQPPCTARPVIARPRRARLLNFDVSTVNSGSYWWTRYTPSSHHWGSSGALTCQLSTRFDLSGVSGFESRLPSETGSEWYVHIYQLRPDSLTMTSSALHPTTTVMIIILVLLCF